MSKGDVLADRAVRFISALPHVEGKWAKQGKRLVLEPWQEEFIRKLFGTVDKDGLRQYRIAYLEIPRKNGKSTMAAAIGLYLLFCDREAGAQIYGAAYDSDQASIVYRIASEMVRRTSLDRRATIIDWRKRILLSGTNSFYSVVDRDAAGSYGLNPSGIIFDELHTQKKPDLWRSLTTGQGAREQPLTVVITTAGIYDTASIAWETHEYACKVRDGIVEDPTFLPVIYAADKDDDWTDEKTWRKANPNYGISVNPEYVATECARAQESPAYENTFRRLQLNQWTQQRTRWISVEKWDECEWEYDEEYLYGSKCYGGLDLGYVSDLTSFVLAFPKEDDVVFLLSYAWCPEARLRDPKNMYRDAYMSWVRDGHLRVTPGDTVDYSQVRADIIEIASKFQLIDFNVDWAFQAAQLAQELAAEGLTPIPMRMGHISFAAPMREFEERLLSQRIAHNGDPLLRWCIDNVVVKQNEMGNLKPDKGSAKAKIDPFVATVMALDRTMKHEDGTSVYSERAAAGEELITWA